MRLADAIANQALTRLSSANVPNAINQAPMDNTRTAERVVKSIKINAGGKE